MSLGACLLRLGAALEVINSTYIPRLRRLPTIMDTLRFRTLSFSVQNWDAITWKRSSATAWLGTVSWWISCYVRLSKLQRKPSHKLVLFSACSYFVLVKSMIDKPFLTPFQIPWRIMFDISARCLYLSSRSSNQCVRSCRWHQKAFG